MMELSQLFYLTVDNGLPLALVVGVTVDENKKD